MSNEFSCEYAMSAEVAKMCTVAKGPNHGPAPIPEEGKWVQAKEITDISAYTTAPANALPRIKLMTAQGIKTNPLPSTGKASKMPIATPKSKA